METQGNFIEGGWLVFACLAVAWLAMLIRQRIKEKDRLVIEMEEQSARIESLAALNHILSNTQPDSEDHAPSQTDKPGHFETVQIEAQSARASSLNIHPS